MHSHCFMGVQTQANFQQQKIGPNTYQGWLPVKVKITSMS